MKRLILCLVAPPYFNLEKYSDDSNDISNMSYDNFLLTYKSIISKTISKLKKGHLAVFVVSEVRKTKNRYGIGYYGLVPDTIKAFEEAGAEFYNEIILLNNKGNAGLRANKYMRTKKVVRVHQNILCFRKK